jgi:hypothetical protein
MSPEECAKWAESHAPHKFSAKGVSWGEAAAAHLRRLAALERECGVRLLEHVAVLDRLAALEQENRVYRAAIDGLEAENRRLARENREMWHVLSLIADGEVPDGAWAQRIARAAQEGEG